LGAEWWQVARSALFAGNLQPWRHDRAQAAGTCLQAYGHGSSTAGWPASDAPAAAYSLSRLAAEFRFALPCHVSWEPTDSEHTTGLSRVALLIPAFVGTPLHSEDLRVIRTFEIARVMSTSVLQIEKTHGHLLPDAIDRARAALDAWEAPVSVAGQKN
jgi:hypothetical protein